MAGKKREESRGNRKTSHPCDRGWRVRWTAEFRREAIRLGLWRSVHRELNDMNRRLRKPVSRDKLLLDLMKNSIVADVYIKKLKEWFPTRRIYFGRRTSRGLFIIRDDICRVWFVTILPRTDSTYKRRKRRV